MPAATTTPTSPAQTPLSVQRPALSPRKRKLSDVVVSPTSMDEVASSNNSSSLPLEERVISPKKKARAEERSGDLSKWESHVVASLASALDLGSMDDTKDDYSEPIAFYAAPAGDLAADELEMLRHFLA